VQSDQVYLGITQVWEALLMMTVADVWGDVPYSEAAKGIAQPVLDNQMDVYAALQAKLSEAITNLSGSGLGPGPADLVYNGDKDLWLKAAHTLKARLYMHTAEVNSADYQSALTETASGIASEDENWTTYQSTTTGEINHWYQFRIQRGTDIGAGKYLVDLMKARNDPRLTEYFSPGPAAPGGAIIGAPPNAEDNGTFAWLGPERGLPEFRQPVITYDENAMIRAEAQFKTGDEDAALATLNAYRATVGLDDLNVSGPQLYNAIMEEKYVALFQNLESWNDYKRTCYPNLPPADGSDYLPARLLYGTAERNANPNIPPPSAQPLRNANDPPTPTDPLGNACLGQGS
jgi:hypothetical protein